MKAQINNPSFLPDVKQEGYIDKSYTITGYEAAKMLDLERTDDAFIETVSAISADVLL